MRTNTQTHPKIAEEIVAYFLRNPNAADDLEGIVRFRLLDEQIYRCVGEVCEALEWLVSIGLLNQTKTPGSGSIFSLNKMRRSEAEEFVEGGSSSAESRRKNHRS